MSFIDWVRENPTRAVITGAVCLAVGGGTVFTLVSPGSQEEPSSTPPAIVSTVGPSVSAPASQGGGSAPVKSESPSQESVNSLEGKVTDPETGEELDIDMLTGSDHEQAPEAQDGTEFAKKFFAQWLNTDGGEKAWLARLKPMTTKYLYEQFQETDIRNLPSGWVVKDVEVVSGSASARFADARVTFENGTEVTLTLSPQPDGSWKADMLG